MAESKVSTPIVINKSSNPIQRVKMQEEEEHWISEEELYTEGSSDEEKGHQPKSRPTKQLKGALPRCKKVECPPTQVRGNTDMETEESPIPWRPKRGSIKLPGVDIPLSN